MNNDDSNSQAMDTNNETNAGAADLASDLEAGVSEEPKAKAATDTESKRGPALPAPSDSTKPVKARDAARAPTPHRSPKRREMLVQNQSPSSRKKPGSQRQGSSSSGFFKGFVDLRDDVRETQKLAAKRRATRRASMESAAASALFGVDSPSSTRDLDKTLAPAEVQALMDIGHNHEEIARDSDIHMEARTKAIRHMAAGAIAFFILFQVVGISFLVHVGDVTIPNAMLFSIYTITTAGFGSVVLPHTPGILIFVSFYIFVGLAALTIMVSQIYQLIALEARQGKVTEDKEILARKGLLHLEAKIQAKEAEAEADRTHANSDSKNSSDIESNNSNNTTLAEDKAELTKAANKLKKIQREAEHRTSKNPVTKLFLRVGRAIRKLASLNEIEWALMILAYFLALYATGMGSLMHLESWNFGEALYFVTYVLTTVGFGDVAPSTDNGIWFTIFWLGTNISFVSLYMGNLGRYYTWVCNWNVSRIETKLLQLDLGGNKAKQSIESATMTTIAKTKDSRARISTMKDVLDFVQGNLNNDALKSDVDMAEFLTLKAALKRSPVFVANHARRPSFSLLALVQQRLARIMASEVAGNQTSFEAKDMELSTTIDSLQDTIDKWMIPTGAHEAFRVVAFDTLLYVGEKALIVDGCEAIFALPPSDVHQIFSPLLVAMEDAGTMASWLARTELLARSSFHTTEEGAFSGLLSQSENSTSRLDIEKPTFRSSIKPTKADIGVLKALSTEYRTALERKQIQSMAKFKSYRQTAMIAIAMMVTFWCMSVTVMMTVADANFRDALLFTMYTVTSAGFGTVEIPKTQGFLIWVVLSVFVGITCTAILAAQVYQYLELKSVRVRHAQDKAAMAIEGLNDLNKLGRSSRSSELATKDDVNETIRKELIAALELVPESISKLVGRHATKSAFACCRSFPILATLAVPMYLVFLIFLGAIVSTLIEGWPFSHGFYYASFCMSTVGYGDIVPKSNAGIWFSIFYLPLNVSFLALYLGTVAHYYVRGSKKYMQYIETHMRKQLREQNGSAENSEEADAEHVATEPRVQAPSALFGLPLAKANRRERIKQNSLLSWDSSAFFDEVISDTSSGTQTSLVTKDLLRMIHEKMPNNSAIPKSDPSPSTNPTCENKLSISAFQGTLERPSLALHFLIIERAAHAIATDVAGFQSSIEVRDNTFVVERDGLKDIADKWLIPSRARKAFRAVAFESLFFVGERNLLLGSGDVFFDLNPMELDDLFTPFLVAMGDSEAMEAWLASTEVIASECMSCRCSRVTSGRAKLDAIEEVTDEDAAADSLMARRSVKNTIEGCFPCNPGNAVLIKM